MFNRWGAKQSTTRDWGRRTFHYQRRASGASFGLHFSALIALLNAGQQGAGWCTSAICCHDRGQPLLQAAGGQSGHRHRLHGRWVAALVGCSRWDWPQVEGGHRVPA